MTTPIKKKADGKASMWTPRQALTHALNLLNDPERKITRCVIILGDIDDEDESDTSLVVATKNAYETTGILATALGAIAK